LTRKVMILPWAAALVCVLSGCITTSPSANQTAFRRVCLIEFVDKTEYAGTGGQFAALLLRELTHQSPGVDLIAVQRDAFPELGDPFAAGKLSVGVLARARRQYRAEAVVIGSVDQYNPYWKPSVRLTFKIVETANGKLIYESSRSWDAADSLVGRAIEDYYEANRDRRDFQYGPQIYSVSPKHFLQFVAHTVAREMLAYL